MSYPLKLLVSYMYPKGRRETLCCVNFEKLKKILKGIILSLSTPPMGLLITLAPSTIVVSPTIVVSIEAEPTDLSTSLLKECFLHEINNVN